MAQRPRGSRQPEKPQRAGRVIRAHEQEEEGTTRIESGDILLGAVLLIVIPTAIYIALGAFGMPVGGRKGTREAMTWEEQLAAKENTDR